MKEEKTDLAGAARILGKSPRQIMRDIAAGKLPASGGGRGVPYWFDLAALRGLASNAPAVELLARVRWGFESRHLGAGFLFYFKEPPGSPYSAVMLDASLPPVSAVPPPVMSWARRLGDILTPQEMQFFAALFVAVEFPAMNPDPRKGDAFRDMLAAVGHIDSHRNRAAVVYLIDSITRGDRPAVERATEGTRPTKADPARFPELAAVRGALHAYGKRARHRDRTQGKEKPTGPALASILGVSRPWVAVLWRAVKHKLGKPGVAELLGVFGWVSAQELPRFMKGR